MAKYTLSELQAQAILEMRLQRLTGLERAKIVSEYEEVMKAIKELEAILADERLVMKIVGEELAEIKEKYGDVRRTVIQGEAKELNLEDLIQEEDMVVTVSHNGYIKRNPISIYRAQRRGGRGKTGMTTREEDFVEAMFIASTHSYMLVFSSSGKLYWLRVHEIPQVGRVARGQAISNLINMSSTDRIAAVLAVKTFEEGKFIFMATKHGVVKKTELMAFANPRSGGIIATNIDEGDALISARLTDGVQDILIGTRQGQSIRFHENDVRAMGRVARGVRGITLGKDDAVVGMEALAIDAPVLTVTERGYGKRTGLDEYRIQSRGGRGIITIKTNDRNGPVVGITQVTDMDDVMIVTDGGKVIRSRAKEVSVIGRNTQGVRLIALDEGERVVSFAKLGEREED